MSYGSLAGRVAALSALIADEFTLIVTGDPIETVVAWLACYHKGVSCALIDPGVYFTERATLESQIPFGQVIADQPMAVRLNCKLVVMDPAMQAIWTPPNSRRADALMILASSRSTGQLKLIQHANALLPLHYRFWLENFPLQDGDMVAAPRQLPFGYGFIVAITWALWAGKALSFAATTKSEVRVHPRSTVSALPPLDLLRAGRLSKLRMAVSSGAMIPNDHWSLFKEAYPDVSLVNLVGATETLTPYLLSTSPSSFKLFGHYQGQVTTDSGAVVVGKPGRFETKGFVHPNYWNSPDLDAKICRDGWVRLGDYAVDNGDGTFKFLGRNTISFDLENALRVDHRVKDIHFTTHLGRPVLLVASDSLTRSNVLDLIKPFGIKITADNVSVVAEIFRTESGKVPASEVEAALPKMDKESALQAASSLVDENLTPYVAIASVKNLFVRQMYFEREGSSEVTHAHPIDHITLLAKGSLDVTVNGFTTTYAADRGAKIIYIKKDLEHHLRAREDSTLAFCIHALRGDNVTEDILDPDSVPAGVDAIEAGIAAPILNEPRAKNDRIGFGMEVIYA